MTKKEMLQTIQAETGLTLAEIDKVYELIFDIIVESLVRSKKVCIHKFGTFRVTRMSRRKGMDPRTKKPMVIPAKRRMRFQPSGLLKDSFDD